MNGFCQMWHVMPYMPIIMMIVMILFVCFIVKCFRAKNFNCGSMNSNNKQEETALDVLKKRYARGEISKEQFEQMKKDIL